MQQPVAIIGAALDLGAGRRGVDMGPSAIRYAGLAERLGALGRDAADVVSELRFAEQALTAAGEALAQRFAKLVTG